MNLRVIILFILLLSGFCINAQEYVSLNGEWQFALVKTEQEAKRLEDFSSPGFSSQKFKKIPVPSNWAVLGYEEPVLYRGFKENKASEGFYLHKFETPEG